MTIGVRQLKTGLNKVMGRNLIARVSKTGGHRQADSGRIKPGSETVNNPDPDSFRPQNQGSRAQNPEQTRPQPPVERGWADQADSRPPLRGPGGWGGDWYLWHAADGLRAIAATALGCMQAGAQKLGVIEASYASAIIGVLSPNTVRRRNWRSEELPSLNTWIRYLSQCGGERGLFLLRRTVLFLAPCRLIAQFRGPWKLAWLQRPLPGLAAKLIPACRKPAINVKGP